MNIIARRNTAITIGIVVFILVILFVLWMCVVITDFVRYKTGNIPIFAFNVTIEDLTNGDIETYKGLGYKFVDKNIDNINTKEFYLLGFKI
ncbi:MAG: hypothetical protein IKV94_01165 [Clostridia bacterium]|nr:hypothetical protein [Clostridia bacterium]